MTDMDAAERARLAKMDSAEVIAYCKDDAAKWAWCFCEKFPDAHERGVDWDLMVGWFANAIEVSALVRDSQAHEQGRQAGLEEAAVLLDGKPAIYPTSVFLEPPAGEHGKTVDGCSAAALRKTAPRWAGEVRALKDKPEGGQ